MVITLKHLSASIFTLISVFFLFSPISAQDDYFLEDWTPKSIASPAEYVSVERSSEQPTVNVVINFTAPITKVSEYNFGNNANVYTTRMWDNLYLVQNLRNLNPHVIRYPGGNLSNEFFWDRAPGERPEDIPADQFVWYGKDQDSGTMSVDNYYKFLEVIGCTGIISINYGYARYGTSDNPVAEAAHLAAEWVRHDNGRTKFWEIGNENYGDWQAGYEIDPSLNQDGQPKIISGDLYGEHALIFADSMKSAATEIGHEIFIGFQAWEEESSWDPVQADWNETMMPVVGEAPDFYIVHNYYTPYEENSDADQILATYQKAGEFKKSVYEDLAEAGLSEKPIALTEYNIFATGSGQQVSHINGLHGALVLGNVIEEKYGLTARWDLANGWDNGDDHGMFSKDEPDVAPFTPYPVFYHLTFFQRYFGDSMIWSHTTDENIVAYASLFSTGQVGIALINKGQISQTVEFLFAGYTLGQRYYWYELKDENGDGSFSKKVFINGEGPSQVSGGPDNYNSIKPYSAEVEGNIKMNVVPYSAVYMLLEGNTIVGVEENETIEVVDDFELKQNYPNPFNPSTVISYLLPDYSYVQLFVYDILGNEIESLVEEYKDPGYYQVNFDSDGLSSGIYLYRINIVNSKGIFSKSKRMTLIR